MVDAEHHEPLIGTTVEIKGTDRRTAADIDGNFSIDVEKGAILKFSYVGYYSKEVEILNDSSLVIELEEDTSRCLSDDFDYTIGQGPAYVPAPDTAEKEAITITYFLGPLSVILRKRTPKNKTA